MIAIESAGNDLGGSRAWDQITRKLFDDELVIWLVVFESIDDPISPKPNRSSCIHMNAACVCISCNIEPRHGHAFCVSRAIWFLRHQSIDQLCACVWTCITHERFDFLWRRWQTCEIEKNSPNKSCAFGGGAWANACFFHARKQESINFICRPLRVFWSRRHRPRRCRECPVRFILSAIINPAPNDFPLSSVE